MAASTRSGAAPGWQFPKQRRYFYYSPQKLKELEKGFILDGVPLSKLANDETDRTSPTLNLGIPQYYGKKDSHCRFHYSKKTSNYNGEDSMMGLVYDNFCFGSASRKYIENRKDLGAGYIRKIYGGHTTTPIAPPRNGYHGDNGYRRNTPNLRYKPSPFDIEDPYEASKPYYLKAKKEGFSAGNIRYYRAKSAKIYRQPPMEVVTKLASSSMHLNRSF